MEGRNRTILSALFYGASVSMKMLVNTVMKMAYGASDASDIWSHAFIANNLVNYIFAKAKIIFPDASILATRSIITIYFTVQSIAKGRRFVV